MAKERGEDIADRKLVLPELRHEMFPKGYELLPGVNQIYELELAKGEMESLTTSELVKRSAYFSKVAGQTTHHYTLCAGPPLRVSDSSSIRLKAFFRVYKFKTGYATHGLFPYRGKFHPQLIKALMNIIGLREQDKVLDPMTGSGTTNIEASVIGLNSIGVDISPFCTLMAQAKVDALNINVDKLSEYAKKPSAAFNLFHKKETQLDVASPANDTQSDTERSMGDEMKNILRLCYLDAMGYARRRKNKTERELFPVVLERYVEAIKNFADAKEKLNLELGQAQMAEGDARDLTNLRDVRTGERFGIEDETIGGIVTSPPYSFAIDYIEGDRQQLEYLGHDVKSLRASMIGLRGEALTAKVANYRSDMDTAIKEMSRVLIPRKYCVVIIGSNTVQLERALAEMGVNLEDKLVELGEKHGLNLEKRMIRPIEGMRNVMKAESVLFLRKGAK